jgi:DNA mismatch repair protein MSH5
VRPILTDDGALEIINGRHPLQELCVQQFIPNDTRVAPGCGRVNVIGGANGSGKSVYLKQVGLIVFMAHVGSFVPADAARIGLRDRLFTRIRSAAVAREGLASAFTADVMQVGVMLNYATPKSLLLMDEFGKGTLVQDGVALLVGTLRHFLRLRDRCPILFVSTHYAELWDYRLLDPADPLVRFSSMQVMSQSATAAPGAQEGVCRIVYLFKLLEGQPSSSSFAAHCAWLADVPQAVLERAAAVSRAWAQHCPLARVTDQREDARDEIHSDVCCRLLGFDPDTGDVGAVMRFFSQAQQRLDALE